MYKYKRLQAGQLPWVHLSFSQSLLNFIITKYLKQEVDVSLSICMDECSPYGLSMASLWPLFLLSKFDNSSHSAARDKGICQSYVIMRYNDVTTSWCRAPNGTLWIRFTCCPNLMFLASPWVEIFHDCRFSNWSFCRLWEI